MEKRFPDVAVTSDVHPGIYSCHAKELVNYLKNISPNIIILSDEIINADNLRIFNYPKNYSL